MRWAFRGSDRWIHIERVFKNVFQLAKFAALHYEVRLFG